MLLPSIHKKCSIYAYGICYTPMKHTLLLSSIYICITFYVVPDNPLRASPLRGC